MPAKYSAFRSHDRVEYDDLDLPSRTKQEFADECDVNKLMKRYERTGLLPQYNLDRQAQYLDLTEIPDFHTAMQMLVEADHAFMRLPANVRREFDNSASDFVEFAQKPENIGKLREWGLAPPLPPKDAANDDRPGDAAPAASSSSAAAQAAPTQ